MILTYIQKVARCEDKLGFTRREFLLAAKIELALDDDQASYLYNRLVGRNLTYKASFSDVDRRDFLDKLDASDIQLSDWEYKFVNGTMGELEFTDPQREAIDRMISRYRDRLKW